MPIETLEDIIEELADRLDAYGSCHGDSVNGCESENCHCRCGWVSELTRRLTDAFETERKLNPTTDKPTGIDWDAVKRAMQRWDDETAGILAATVAAATPAPCPNCHGTRTVTGRHDDGDTLTGRCPECAQGGNSHE